MWRKAVNCFPQAYFCYPFAVVNSDEGEPNKKRSSLRSTTQNTNIKKIKQMTYKYLHKNKPLEQIYVVTHYKKNDFSTQSFKKLRTRFIVSKLFTNKLNTLQSRMFQLIHSNSSLSIKHNISQLSTFHCSVLSFHSDDEVMCGWWKTLKAI